MGEGGSDMVDCHCRWEIDRSRTTALEVMVPQSQWDLPFLNEERDRRGTVQGHTANLWLGTGKNPGLRDSVLYLRASHRDERFAI